MKKFLLSASVALTVICFTACDKVKDLIPAFDIVLPNVPVVIQPTAVSTSEVVLGTGTANFDIDAEIKKYAKSASINNVTSIKIKAVTLSMSNATDDHNLSNFASANVNLATNSNTTVAQLASATVPNAFTTSVAATTTDTELKSYLSGSAYTYTVKGIVRKAITTPTTMVVSTTVTVKP